MLPVTNSKGKYISVLDLEGQFEWIKADAQHSDSECFSYLMHSPIVKTNIAACCTHSILLGQ